MKGVQCYEFFGGIALKNHASFSIILPSKDFRHGSFAHHRKARLVSQCLLELHAKNKTN